MTARSFENGSLPCLSATGCFAESLIRQNERLSMTGGHLQVNMTAKELEDYVERFLAEELEDPEVQLMLVSFEGD